MILLQTACGMAYLIMVACRLDCVHDLLDRGYTCKIKHLQNICKNVLEPREVDGSRTFSKYFILHVTTAYLQAVFDPAKNVCNIFARSKCFNVKHF